MNIVHKHAEIGVWRENARRKCSKRKPEERKFKKKVRRKLAKVTVLRRSRSNGKKSETLSARSCIFPLNLKCKLIVSRNENSKRESLSFKEGAFLYIAMFFLIGW